MGEGYIHFISARHDGDGNKTVCGVENVFPVRANGWRVRDITCPDCDRIITDLVHANFRHLLEGADNAEG